MIKTEIYTQASLEDDQTIKSIASRIKANELVIFPTETVYGIGGSALNKEASKAIYQAKGRPSDNPLIVHISKLEDVDLYAKDISEEARLLMRSFWPGPITFILNKKAIIPYETTGGLNTVALRMPNHDMALRLIAAAGPIAAPSANISGRPSSTEFKHVFEDFNGKVSAIIDGGKTTIGLESTVLDCHGDITLLRPGAITKTMIEQVLEQRILDLSNDKPTDKVLSPGMKYTHYKPKGDVLWVKGEINQVASYVDKLNLKESNHCIICPTDYEPYFPSYKVRTLGHSTDSKAIGQALFSSLRDMDEWGIEKIIIVFNPIDEYSLSIQNRILKAAGYQVITL